VYGLGDTSIRSGITPFQTCVVFPRIHVHPSLCIGWVGLKQRDHCSTDDHPHVPPSISGHGGGMEGRLPRATAAERVSVVPDSLCV
jgi:hypothetical protein